jgi:large subunit ribosomal protein L29
LRVNEVRELPDEELITRLDEVKEELFNLRFQNATGQLENYKRLGILKRDVAKIQTVLRERELGIEPPPEERPEPKPRRRRKETPEESPAEGPEGTEEPELAEQPRARARRRLRRRESEAAEEETVETGEEPEEEE